ncbi:MAG: amino acid ABC transporter permease [Asticcacaulis sp.]
MPEGLLGAKYLGWLWDGFVVTLTLSAIVSLMALALGFFFCVISLSRSRLRFIVTGCLSFLRNTPLLVQFFFWYFGVSALLPDTWMAWLNLPHIGIFGLKWPSYEYLAGFVGLTLYSAAFMAAEFRAGVNNVPAGQIAAAQAMGLSGAQVWQHVVLPQAVRNALSPLGGQVMNVVKNSSLTMAIGLAELSYATRQVETETFRAFQAFGIATILYIAAIAALEGLIRLIRSRDKVLIARRS